jgi:hypothetical protein
VESDGSKINQFQFRFNWESLSAAIEKGYEAAQNQKDYIRLGQLAIKSTRHCFQKDALSDLFKQITKAFDAKDNN